MKIIVSIPDKQLGQNFLKKVKALSYVRAAKKITSQQEAILREFDKITNAQKLARSVKNGKIQVRPIDALLND